MASGSHFSFRAVMAAVLLASMAFVGAAAPAGAASGCGEYSFGFEGTRLLNDGISTSAGPYTISLPAGTYDITATSYDNHDEHPDQEGQAHERWYISLDSGYVSPATNDIADDSNHSTTVFKSQTIGASSTITVHHFGHGGVNSVNPMCVGFTAVALPQADPVTQEPAVEPVKPADRPERVAEAPAPDAQLTDPVGVEVKREVEFSATPGPAPVLAFTGPSSAWTMFIVALSLITIGGGLMLIDRRLTSRATS